MKRIIALLLIFLLTVPADASIIFGPDSFTVGSDTNIDAYPGGGANYTYAVGSGTDLTVEAANDRVKAIGAPDIWANVTNAAVPSTLGDQEIRAVVSNSTISNNGSVHITCKGSGDEAYLGVLDPSSANEVILYELINGAANLLASADRLLVGLTAYTTALTCRSGTQRLIIDGETEITATDATLSTGRPGIYGFESSGSATGWLDNYEVDDLSFGIRLVGVGAQDVDAGVGGTATAAFPAGYSAVAGDFALVFLMGRPEDTALVSAPSGWTEDTNSRVLVEIGANDLRGQVFYRVLQTSDSAPVFTVPGTWDGALGGMAVQMGVWRGVSPANPFDVTTVTSTSGAAATFAPTGVTTVTSNAHVVGFVASFDNNALSMTTPQNFTAWMGGASYDDSTQNLSVAVGSRQKVTPGAVTMPTWTQTINGNDSWVGIAIALRPAVGGVLVDRTPVNDLIGGGLTQ